MTANIELGKPRADKSCAVYIRISVNGTKKRLPANIYLSPSEYSITTKGLKVKNLDKKLIIDELIHKINLQYGESALAVSRDTTASDIIGAVKKKTRSHDFFAFGDDWVKHAPIKSTEDYTVALNRFAAYLQRRTISFEEIDYECLRGFHDFLEGKPRAQSKHLAALRHLWNQAELIYEDDLPRSPFRKFKPARQKRVGQRATDIETIRKIYEYQGGGIRAMLARDCLILSFCTMGMNSVDLYNCTTYKHGVLCYERTKTKDRREDRSYTEVRIHPFIKEIFKRWHEKGTYVFKFHRMYADHRTFNCAINKGIKAMLGKDTKVTYYSMRHAWASIARNELGVDKGTINDGLVHIDTAMDVTDLYIKKDYRLINETNAKVIEYTFAPYIK